MKHDDMIAVIQAHKEGKKLQCRAAERGLEWISVEGEPVWNFANYDYRVRPEPKPDVVESYCARPGLIRNGDYAVFEFRTNLRLTFSGETGDLKLAEVLK